MTVSSRDLYDATTEQKNKVKIVALTASKPEFSQTLYLRTTPMEGDKALKDVRPSNNVLPVTILGASSGNVPTDVKDVQVGTVNAEEYFDLMGRPWERPNRKGIYLKKGQKVVVK